MVRTKRNAFLPRIFKHLLRLGRNGIKKLKFRRKINPKAPRRPRRPRRGPTRPGEPLPEPEEPKIQPPMPYPGIPRRKPGRQPFPGPPRPLFKQAA